MGIDALPDGSGSHHTEYNEQPETGANHHTAGCGANRNQGRPSHGVESENGDQGKSSYGVENASGIRGASSYDVENASGIQGTSSHGVENASGICGTSLYGGGRGKRNQRQTVTRRRMGRRISEHHYTAVDERINILI